jgi:hypothetical protein
MRSHVASLSVDLGESRWWSGPSFWSFFASFFSSFLSSFFAKVFGGMFWGRDVSGTLRSCGPTVQNFRMVPMVQIIPCVLICGLMGLMGATAHGSERDASPAAPPANSETSPTADSARDELILGWLESDRFSERQRGMTELRRLGVSGVSLLRRVAEQGDAEARSRALQLLDSYFRNEAQDQDALSEAAREALQSLASGEGPAARRAHGILHPPSQDPHAMAQIANLQAMRIQAQLRLRAAQQVPPARRVPGRPANPALPNPLPPAPAVEPGPGAEPAQVPQPNEQPPNNMLQRNLRRVIVQQGETKVEIHEGPEGIRMEVTETKDGEVVTERFEAKDLEELEKQHPRAIELYRRTRGRAAVPGGPEIRDPQAALAEITRQQLKTFETRIEAIEQQLADLAENPEGDPRRMADRLRRQIDVLQRAREQLEERLK